LLENIKLFARALETGRKGTFDDSFIACFAAISN
jgi:hypothetical protein